METSKKRSRRKKDSAALEAADSNTFNLLVLFTLISVHYSTGLGKSRSIGLPTRVDLPFGLHRESGL